MCLDRFPLLKVSVFHFCQNLFNFVDYDKRVFIIIIIFYKNYKNAASLFYSYANYSALNLSMKFRNIPQDPQVIFLWLHVAKN